MKMICALMLLLHPAVAAAQAAAAPAPGPVLTTTGAFFALSVADLDASARWYSEKLGLTVVMRVPKQDKAAETVLEGGGLIVELLQLDDAAPAGRDASLVHGFFKTGVMVENFEQALATLRARQVEIAFGPFPAKPGQRANVIVHDNAGNLLQIFGK